MSRDKWRFVFIRQAIDPRKVSSASPALDEASGGKTNRPFHSHNLFWGLVGTVIAAYAIAVGCAVSSPPAAHCFFVISWILAVISVVALLRFFSVFTIPRLVLCIVGATALIGITDLTLVKASPAPEIALYMSCHIGTYPIRVPSGSQISVLPLHSGILRQARIPGADLFENISSENNDFQWPNTHEGKWASKADLQSSRMINSDLYKCELTNAGPTAVKEAQIDIALSPLTANSKPAIYPVTFAPIVRGGKFDFYVINYCPTYIRAAWSDTVRAVPVGDNVVVTSKLELDQAVPTELMVFVEPAFQWQEAKSNCDWEWK